MTEPMQHDEREPQDEATGDDPGETPPQARETPDEPVAQEPSPAEAAEDEPISEWPRGEVPERASWPERDLQSDQTSDRPHDERFPGDEATSDRPPQEAEAFDVPPRPHDAPATDDGGAHAVPATEVGDSTRCPRCGNENRPGIAFCRNCGQRLAPAGGDATVQRPGTAEGTQACPRCGTHNRAGVAFCQNCGANLRAAAPASGYVPPSVEGQPREEVAAPARRTAILGPVVLIIGAVGMAVAWLLPFRYGTDSLWERSFGEPGGYGAAFWQEAGQVSPAIVDQAYFSLAAAAPILAALIVLLAIGGLIRAAPGPLQLIGLVLALLWAAGLVIGFAFIELLGGWTGDLTGMLRELSPGGIIFFLAGLIVIIGCLTRFARS